VWFFCFCPFSLVSELGTGLTPSRESPGSWKESPLLHSWRVVVRWASCWSGSRSFQVSVRAEERVKASSLAEATVFIVRSRGICGLIIFIKRAVRARKACLEIVRGTWEAEYVEEVPPWRRCWGRWQQQQIRGWEKSPDPWEKSGRGWEKRPDWRVGPEVAPDRSPLRSIV